MIDYESVEEVHPNIKCSVNQNEIKGPRYFSFSKINGDNQKVDLSEKSIMLPNIYDINPLIYYRIKRPLKQRARLPFMDLKKYY